MTSGLRIELNATPDALWSVNPTSAAPDHRFAPPEFPLDGKLVTALPVRFERVGEPIPLGPDGVEVVGHTVEDLERRGRRDEAFDHASHGLRDATHLGAPLGRLVAEQLLRRHVRPATSNSTTSGA